MDPLREIVEIKEEANESDFEDESYEDDLIKEEETDSEDYPHEYDNEKRIKIECEVDLGYDHFIAGDSESSAGSSSIVGRKKEDLIDDELLKDLPVRALNQRLKWFTKEDVALLKMKRRTLKNRDYARTSRKKRVNRIQELEIANKSLCEELRRLRRELDAAVAERDSLRAKYQPGAEPAAMKRKPKAFRKERNIEVVVVDGPEDKGPRTEREAVFGCTERDPLLVEEEPPKRPQGNKWVSEIRQKMKELESEMMRFEGEGKRKNETEENGAKKMCDKTSEQGDFPVIIHKKVSDDRSPKKKEVKLGSEALRNPGSDKSKDLNWLLERKYLCQRSYVGCPKEGRNVDLAAGPLSRKSDRLDVVIQQPP